MRGQLDIFDVTRPEFRIRKPVRLVELFAGIGAQAMALRDLGAGFEHHRVIESDHFALASYNAIHGTAFEPADIREISGADLGICGTDRYCYIVTYSFPCQDLSVCGKHRGMAKGSGTRSGLLWEVERLLNETEELPQVLLMENVPQVHGKKNLQDFRKWITFLEEKGYSNYWQDLNAKDYGIAQNRDRCFMVSILGEWNYKFPEPVPLTKKPDEYLENNVEEKFYIETDRARRLLRELERRGELDGGAPGGGCVGSVYYRQEGTSARGICLVGRTVKGEQHDPAVVERAPFPLNTTQDGLCRTIKGQYHKNSVRNFENARYSQTGVIDGRLHRPGNLYGTGAPSPALDASRGGDTKPMAVSAHPDRYRIRKLTPRECWRLMGFSDEDFDRAAAVNSNTQLYRQAGNSIVKDVLMAVFAQMTGGNGSESGADRCGRP